MIRIKLDKPAEPHEWFAWYPVTAEQKTPTGLMYFKVWLRKVTRVYLRVGGMSQWVYTL